MREILFRGKKTGFDEWVQGFITSPCEKSMCTLKQTSPVLTWYVDAETVGQYAGFTDKNGKKIFEGDIVVCKQAINGNWIDYHTEIGFVEMKYGAFGLHRKQGYYRPFKDWLEDYEYEVIGNIHDNPELLKGGAEE